MQIRPVWMAVRHWLMGVLVGVTMTLREAWVPVRVVSIIMAMRVCMHDCRVKMIVFVPLLEKHVE